MQGVCPQPLLGSSHGSAAALRAGRAWYQTNPQRWAGSSMLRQLSLTVWVVEGLPGAFPHQRATAGAGRGHMQLKQRCSGCWAALAGQRW